jgi:phosphoglycolate phosphatase/putative hydrolase of the HAD superfamily
VIVHALPDRVSALIFDVDSTLYTCPAFADGQIRKLIERLAQHLGKSPAAMESEIEGYRAAWSTANGGKKLSLGNTFVAFGVPIEESVRWRTQLVDPSEYLSVDAELRASLISLARRAGLGVVTNNPAAVGRRILAALGVEDLFKVVIGLDTCGVSKPHAAPFLAAAAALGSDAGSCIAVGDRYDIDIALPLELGMGGILVDGVEDVYRLPATLADRLQP